jgi:Na+-translocating ferredoxin:NAD+ oxidoreductase RnfD subunit
MTASDAAVVASPGARRRAPFLLWPVARREFYQAIMIALILPLAWGVSIFGVHALLIIVMAVAAAAATQGALRRFTSRGKLMTFNHTITSAMLLSALAPETCPIWLAGIAGIAVAVLIWLAGLPGRQRVHVGLLVAIFLSLAVGRISQGPILVQDALVVGNLGLTTPLQHYRWPRRAAVRGRDAVTVPAPDHVLAKTLRVVSDRPQGAKARSMLNIAFGTLLPPPTELFLGAMPGRIGVVGVLGIILAGLILAYRNILNPAAWGMFILFVLVGLIFAPLSAHSMHHQFWQSLGGIWYLPPERAIDLLFVEICSGDFLFASVFLLALPGTLPLSPRSRWVFLLAAGFLAALFSRIALPLPPASTAILMLQPLAPWFDSILPRRSWIKF